MRKRTKGMIAPIVVAVLLAAYFVGWLLLCLWLPMPVWIKIVGGLIAVCLLGVDLFVLVERVREIRSGETDDLSQY